MKLFIFHLASVFGKITLLILTFVVGIMLTILLSEISPPNVTLCQLARNPTWYTWRTVRVEADGRGIFGGLLVVDETCPSLEAWAGVSRDENNKPFGAAETLFIESGSEAYKARVLVTGRFDLNASRGCYDPKFGIKATSVELKSEITTEPLKRQSEE